ncbi:MAG: DUF2721 domain-containing protein [Candidatus Eremiobacteraeota bacterium]|nr:DUF2721 domain-containing protein [Candidatus Eremiobacteraeota bacterium]MCW5865986.1 DUF2721 domain-containing protein [Candidatus Eremiobacteraeota bacterium]
MELASPFQILTLIVAPAVLTNSSSVLSLSTSNRFARAVDRSRALYDKLKDPEGLSQSEKAIFTKQLPIVRHRGLLLVRAMTAFYTSVGAFSATALTSLIGAGAEMYGQGLAARILTVLAVSMGCVGVLGLVSGTALLVRETWVAFKFLEMETHMGEELPG